MSHSQRSEGDHQRNSFEQLNDADKHSARIVTGPPTDATNANPVPVSLPIQSPTIFNKSIPSADTEVDQVIPDGTKKMLIRIRGLAEAKIAFTSTESGTKYITIPRGAAFTEDNLNTNSLTLYIQTEKASQVAEILTWS